VSALAGRKIVVTRAPRAAGALCELLRQRGASPLLYPCIDFLPPEDLVPLKRALEALAAGKFDWLVFTSATAVEAISPASPLPAFLRIAVIGAATAEAMQSTFGREADFVAPEATRRSLAAAIPIEGGQRILLPQSDLAPTELADRLSEAGAIVLAVPAYRTVLGTGGVDLPRMLAGGEVDAITITSGSCACYLHRRLRDEGDMQRVPHAVLLACLGQGAADVLTRELGYEDVLVARSGSQRSLLDALESHYRKADARTPI
jgi:uroporphyrinogen-III synthase